MCIPVNIIVIAWGHITNNSALSLLGFFSLLLVCYPFMGAVNEKNKDN